MSTTLKQGMNYSVMLLIKFISASVDLWVSRGGEAWQLIDPVDGFHPSQTGQVIQEKTYTRNS